MNLPGNARVFHGGPCGKMRGWPGAGSSGPNPDTIRVWLDEKAWHYANSNPVTSALHATANDGLYGYKTDDFDQGDGCFATFAKPHKDWIQVLSGTTKIQLTYFFYADASVAAPNNIGYFNTNAYIMRPGETVDFAKSGGQFMSLDFSVPALQVVAYTFNNYVIADPAGSGAAGECLIYLKLRREYGPNDTYTGGQIRLLGGLMEFPLS